MLEIEEISTLLGSRSDLEDEFDLVGLEGSDPGSDFTPLVSSKIEPQHWVLMARQILACYDNYAGFVLLHGTDTMAWTASALSFLIANLGKPVVLTGSQRPIREAPSDALSNFVSSVMLAGSRGGVPVVPEVVICFGGRILRGNRTQKVSAASLQGFDSPNLAPLGTIGRTVDVDVDRLLPGPAGREPFLMSGIESDVADIMMFPGMTSAQLATAIEPVKGAVLRTFGAGNAPGGQDVEAVLREASDGGKLLVNVTQCNEGTIESGMLSGSRSLAECGVVSGMDLTPEAALTKLMVLLGSGTTEAARSQMQIGLRGEQTFDLVELRPTITDRLDEKNVIRFVLSDALHGRVRVENLESAVLRLRRLYSADDTVANCHAYLNYWAAGFDGAALSGSRDVRRLEWEGNLVPAPTGGRGQDVVVDVTSVCRQVFEPGIPITLNLVSDRPITEPEVVLSLFMGPRC